MSLHQAKLRSLKDKTLAQAEEAEALRDKKEKKDIDLLKIIKKKSPKN